ncbi:MAG: alanine--tRNA ligase-related protein, partial [Gemmatimonadales bacterium]
MTERLYYRDSELLEFDAMAIEHAGDARHVVLDRTAFYPTSGGQPHDTGTLAGAQVVDVIDADVGVVHVVNAPIELGPVHGRVDAARRRDHMQQHTAQHLISAVAAERFHWETVSVHFGDRHSTIEFDVASGTAEQLHELERVSNELVGEARSVSVTFEDAERVSAELRKSTTRTGTLRII